MKMIKKYCAACAYEGRNIYAINANNQDLWILAKLQCYIQCYIISKKTDSQE